MDYAVETLSLTKIFSDWWGRNKVFAVDDLNLKVRKNEVFGLLGPNGSGKTTTLKMLLGLLHPTKGRALCLGGDATEPQINTHIGFLPEESYLYKYLSAAETLDFYGRLFRLPAKVRKMRTEALLDMVGLKAVAHRHVGTFSKGMARRIGLAQALINDPDLLILDEPTTGLDPIGTRQIKDLIIELAKRGKTILLCSHLLADVEDVCDRIAILYGGKIQAAGHVRDLLQRTDKTEITTGPLDHAALEKIERIMNDEHADYSIANPMDKLETFFMSIVARARRQALPTSGAESKTHISDFLTARAAEKANPSAILDELVSAPVSSPSSKPAISDKTEPPAHTQIPEKADELLRKLTEPEQPKPISSDVKQPAPTKEQENLRQTQKNILDRLTGAEKNSHNPPQKENHTGDTTDA